MTRYVRLAAHDAPAGAKAAADFVSAGPEDDRRAFAEAVEWLGPEGGSIELSAGTFDLRTIPHSVHILGTLRKETS